MVGVSVREWKNAHGLVENMAKSIDYIGNKYNVNIILIPMHYPEDLSISYDILSRVAGGVVAMYYPTSIVWKISWGGL